MMGAGTKVGSKLPTKRQLDHANMWQSWKNQAARLSYDIKQDTNRLEDADRNDKARIKRIKARKKARVRLLRGLYVEVVGMIVKDIVTCPTWPIIDFWQRRQL